MPHTSYVDMAQPVSHYTCGGRVDKAPTSYALVRLAAGRKPHAITAVLKRLSQLARLWGKGESLYLGSADALQCYDHVTLTL
eukprot:7923322-Pyramimonas_sp.AAC.1